MAESSFNYLHMELVQMALGSVAKSGGSPPSTAQLQQASRKIEAVGFQVGQRLAQRYTKDRQRLGDTLEIIKFICKDFWMEVYRKQIDKLQTNNRGVYMLQDNSHPVLTRCSPSVPRQASAKQMAMLHIKFPSGLIRGAHCAGRRCFRLCGSQRAAVANSRSRFNLGRRLEGRVLDAK